MSRIQPIIEGVCELSGTKVQPVGTHSFGEQNALALIEPMERFSYVQPHCETLLRMSHWSTSSLLRDSPGEGVGLFSSN